MDHITFVGSASSVTAADTGSVGKQFGGGLASTHVSLASNSTSVPNLKEGGSLGMNA